MHETTTAADAIAARPEGADLEHLPVDQVLAHFAVQPDRGLSSAEAVQRLATVGPNALVEKQTSLAAKIFSHFTGPIAYMIEAAAVVSAVIGHWDDFVIIAALLFFNVALELWQDHKASDALAALKRGLAPEATVLRDGKWQTVAASTLVPGDIVRVRLGVIVPADLRFTAGDYAAIDQAALTGESLPVEKRSDPGSLATSGPDSPALLFLGTSIVSGTGNALVFASGPRTAFGDIVARLAGRPEETEFERGMRRFGLLILRTVVFLVLFILVVNLSVGRDAMQSLLFSVALAVGLTPEFLPMITTVTLAQGALAMARERVIVKHLSAIQNLGSIDILCSDKTGTLTAGSLSLESALDPLGQPSQRSLFLAQLNSRFETGIRSPLDAAILAAPAQDGEEFHKTQEIPFDFERRRLSVVLEGRGERLLVTKGAPESVLEVCASYEVGGEVRPLDADA